MKKEYSIRRLFFIIIFVTLLLLSTTAAAYCVYSFSSYSNQLLEKNALNLTKYADNLEQELNHVQENLRSLAYTDPHFTQLTFSSYPDSRLIPIRYSVQEYIRTFTPVYSITLLYEKRDQRLFFYHGSALFTNNDYFLNERRQITSFRDEYLVSGAYSRDKWFVTEPEGEYYLTYVSGNDYASVTSFISLSKYAEQHLSPSDVPESAVLFFSGDQILSSDPDRESPVQKISDIRTDSETVESVFVKGQLIQRISLPGYSLGISVITPAHAILKEVLPQIIFAIFMVILTVAIMLIMGRVMRRMLLFPLQEIAQFSRELEDRGIPGKPAEKSAIREYNEIRTSLVQLLDKQAELEQERLTKEQAREHAVLQYYQLQTRSHFFLNCLKSLYNMSENNQIPKMQAMILAFSNHLRYIFHDNLMTVPLESELREVSDYHRIILLDYSRIFILTQNVPVEFMKVEVPPLLIQTFLENTYKYNSKTGEPLVFEISAEKEELSGKAFLKLTLSDNGNGYSEEVLLRINEELTGSYDQFNVGINNLRRRLAILYHGECRTEFRNKAEGGACAVIHIPLQG